MDDHHPDFSVTPDIAIHDIYPSQHNHSTSISQSNHSNHSHTPSHHTYHISNMLASYNLPNSDLPLRGSNRVTKPPSFLQDYHCNLIENTIHLAKSDDIQEFSQSKYFLSFYIPCDNFSSAHT